MFEARVKSVNGATDAGIGSIAVATTTYVPDTSAIFALTGSATITTLDAPVYSRGRIVTFYQLSGSTVFTNTEATTTAGQMRVGAGANLTLAAGDVVTMFLHPDGWWFKISNSDLTA